MDHVADLVERVAVERRADDLVAEADGPEHVQLVALEVVADRLRRLEAARVARRAVVFDQAVHAAEELVRLRPVAGIRIPLVERLARRVPEEVGALAVGAVPVGQHLGGEVKVGTVSRLLVEHDERLEDRHRGESVHRERPRVVELQVAAVQHVDQLLHLPLDRGEDLPIARRLVRHQHAPLARRLVRHQHAPHRVLAVPDVPDGIPAVGLPRLLGVGNRDKLLVLVAAEIAVGILRGHEAVAFLLHELRERGVGEVVGHARGGEHLLAPELAAPHAAVSLDVVVAVHERTPSLGEHVQLREVARQPRADEVVHLRRGHALQAHVPQTRGLHGVLHREGRACRDHRHARPKADLLHLFCSPFISGTAGRRGRRRRLRTAAPSARAGRARRAGTRRCRHRARRRRPSPRPDRSPRSP